LLSIAISFFWRRRQVLADRYSKRDVIVRCKIAEIVIMALAVVAIMIGNIYFMFVVVILIGAQAALFGPAKLAVFRKCYDPPAHSPISPTSLTCVRSLAPEKANYQFRRQ